MKTLLPPALPTLLLVVVVFGSGCHTTQHYATQARPHEVTAAHRIDKLTAAFATEDGRLLLRAAGCLAGQANPTELTISLPAPTLSPRRQRVERIIVPASSVQAGWLPSGELRPVAVAPAVEFMPDESYDFARLQNDGQQPESVRLVRRAGPPARWELLHVNSTGGGAISIFEVKAISQPASRPAS